MDNLDVVDVDDKSLVQSTADESVTLRGFPCDKSKTGAWRAAPFIFALEFGEVVGQLSIALNLVPYLLIHLYQTTDKATTIFTNFMGTTYLTSVIWGFVADSYFGRFWTIGLGISIMLIGSGLITLSTAVSSIKPPPCTSMPCPPAHGNAMTALFAAIYLIAIGSGGIKPCLPPLGADQFDDTIPAERRRRPLYFNLLFCSLQFGALIVLTGIVWIQDNLDRTKGFGIPAAILFGTVLLFFAGTPFYRHKPPAGSGFTRMAQVFVAAIRKHSATRPPDVSLLYNTTPKDVPLAGRKLAQTHDLRYLDRAAIIQEDDIGKDGISTSRWKLCPVSQVEEAKRVLQVTPIWITTIVPYILFAQISTYSVIQCLSMDRHLGHFRVPAASFQAVSLIITCILLPLYDLCFVPLLRKFTGHPRGISPLYRIGTGLALSIFSMLSAALVEIRRKKVAQREGLLDNPLAQLSMTAFYLVPQIGILGVTEIFLTVGQIEFFYEEMPDGMRSLGAALYCSAISIGYFMTSFLVPAVTRITRKGAYGGWLSPNINRGDLQNFYWLLVALSIANLGFFLIAAHFYTYKRLDSGGLIQPINEASEFSADSARSSAARPSDAQLLDHRRYGNSTGANHT